MGSREILPGAGVSPAAPLGGDVMPLDAQETPQGLGMNTLKMTNMLAFNTSFEVSMGSPLASNPIKHLCCDDGRMKTGNHKPTEAGASKHAGVVLHWSGKTEQKGWFPEEPTVPFSRQKVFALLSVTASI